jgi:hypothetical protein
MIEALYRGLIEARIKDVFGNLCIDLSWETSKAPIEVIIIGGIALDGTPQKVAVVVCGLPGEDDNSGAFDRFEVRTQNAYMTMRYICGFSDDEAGRIILKKGGTLDDIRRAGLATAAMV